MTDLQTTDVMSQLTAFEMSQAERTAGLSIASLEDANYPKVDLLGAIAWVWSKRTEPTLTFAAFMKSNTLEQITDVLGMNDQEQPDAPFPGGTDAVGAAGEAGDREGSVLPAHRGPAV